LDNLGLQDRNGVLDAREIGPALQGAGFRLDAQAVNALHHRHNKYWN